MPRITFVPSGKTVDVAAGTKLSEACRLAGFALPVPCGEKGLCGKCRVLLLQGCIPVDGRQRNCLPASFLESGWRAACVVDEYDDISLADPADNRKESIILTDFLGRQPGLPRGLWQKTVEMDEPSTEDQRDDVTRLVDALRQAGAGSITESDIDLQLLGRLPAVLRDARFCCRVTGLQNRILSVEPDEGVPSRRLGLAVDLGTTTMAAALCDLDAGDILAVSSRANPQAERGDDVITRVDYASRGRAEQDEMQRHAIKAIMELAENACRDAGVDDPILLVAVGGNTVMNHLLVGVDPRPLALSPFIPAFKGPVTMDSSRIGWDGDRPPLLMIVPNIAAYVGGDITAGILAHDVAEAAGNVLFLDVGTNGEIVLAAGGRIYACAAAAGPAFEGARIKQGMRAAPGAVSRVSLESTGDIDVGVVENIRPARGICGTGLLDAVAALLQAGLIDEGGRLLDPEEAAGEGLNKRLVSRVYEDEDGPAVWLEMPSSHGDSGVALTSRDVREFQLAKGAIAAGVKVLLRVAGISPGELNQVLLAGGFGNYLSPASALAVGLLPPEVPVERIRSVGNASLAGTRLYLFSDEERARARDISREVEYIELSGRADFQAAFAEEMMFPSAKDEG